MLLTKVGKKCRVCVCGNDKLTYASVVEWSITLGCKPSGFGLRRFESYPAHQIKTSASAEFFIFSPYLTTLIFQVTLTADVIHTHYRGGAMKLNLGFILMAIAAAFATKIGLEFMTGLHINFWRFIPGDLTEALTMLLIPLCVAMYIPDRDTAFAGTLLGILIALAYSLYNISTDPLSEYLRDYLILEGNIMQSVLVVLVLVCCSSMLGFLLGTWITHLEESRRKRH